MAEGRIRSIFRVYWYTRLRQPSALSSMMRSNSPKAAASSGSRNLSFEGGWPRQGNVNPTAKQFLLSGRPRWLTAIWTIGTNMALRAHYAKSDLPELPANATAMAQSASVIIVAAAGYSSLHLLWLLPISYLTGYFALRVRIVGRVVWLCGYLIVYTIPANW